MPRALEQSQERSLPGVVSLPPSPAADGAVLHKQKGEPRGEFPPWQAQSSLPQPTATSSTTRRSEQKAAGLPGAILHPEDITDPCAVPPALPRRLEGV